MRKSLASLRQTLARQPASPARPTGGRPATRRPARPAAGLPARPVFGVQFVRDVYAELKKVVWPTREEARNLTIVVLVVSIAVGLLLGAVDLAFSWLINAVIVGG